MKRILFISLFSLCGFSAAGVNPEFLLQNYKAGLVAVGMSAEEAVRLYPAERTKRSEPFKGLGVIDIFASADQKADPILRLNLDPRAQTVQSIAVYDKRYQTVQGVTLGSTFGALKKAHPKLNVRLEEGEMDRYLLAEIEGQGIVCDLPCDEAVWKSLKRLPNPRDIPQDRIPDTTIIRAISLYRSSR
jgi:hypothetical protein